MIFRLRGMYEIDFLYKELYRILYKKLTAVTSKHD